MKLPFLILISLPLGAQTVSLTWTAPGGCTTTAPCTYIVNRASLTSGSTSCPLSGYSQLASSVSGTAYTDSTPSGVVCYTAQTVQGGAVSGDSSPSNGGVPIQVSTTPPPPSTITGVTVTCNPPSISLTQTSICTATVTGTGTFNSAVTWSQSSGGAISSTGIYAPSSTATITATSVQDSTKNGSASVGLTGSGGGGGGTPPPSTTIAFVKSVSATTTKISYTCTPGNLLFLSANNNGANAANAFPAISTSTDTFTQLGKAGGVWHSQLAAWTGVCGGTGTRTTTFTASPLAQIGVVEAEFSGVTKSLSASTNEAYYSGTYPVAGANPTGTTLNVFVVGNPNGYSTSTCTGATHGGGVSGVADLWYSLTPAATYSCSFPSSSNAAYVSSVIGAFQ